MDHFRRIMRWMFAIGSVGLSIALIRRGLAGGGSGSGGLPNLFLPILGSLLLLVISAVLIAPDLVAIATRPLFALVDSIFFPGGKLSKPVLSYTLPEFYTKEGRYEEALEEYQKILRYYPKEAPAYLGAIDLLIVEFGDHEEARELFERARRKLQDKPEKWIEIENRWQYLRNRHEIGN